MHDLRKHDLDNRFSYHPPRKPEVATEHERIRRLHRHLAGELAETLPESRELSLAVTKLEESMMWANAALARHQHDGENMMAMKPSEGRPIRDEPQA